MRCFALAVGALVLTGCFQPGQFVCLGESPPPECQTPSTGVGSSTSTGGSSTSTGDGTSTGEGSDGASEAGTSTAAASTTASSSAPAVCGDGVLDEGEECDDGDLDPANGCNQCFRDRWIFVTGPPDVRGYEIGGLYGADQDCRMRAALAGHPTPLQFKAWLSDSTTDARDRLFHGQGRYVLPNGLPVANDWDELVSGALQRPIDSSEHGEYVEAGVWTGTQPDGTRLPGISHCEDWNDVTVDSLGSWGFSIYMDARWTHHDEPIVNPTDCFAMRALYCLEQE